MNKTTHKSLYRPQQTASDGSRSHPVFSNDDSRLARIRRKAPHERRSDEIAYERGAIIVEEQPHERAAGIAGMLHDIPAMQSAFVLVGSLNERGFYRWVSAVVDYEEYFGGEQR